MSDVTLIQCVDSKNNGPLPAHELYTGGYWDAMWTYAQAKDGDEYILSAKHGLLDPETVIDNYDAYGLSDDQATNIANELHSKGYDTVTITAGKKYTDPLVPELEAYGMDVIEVGRGLKIGERVSQLQRKTRELENHTLC